MEGEIGPGGGGKMNGQDGAKKTQKRKRSSLVPEILGEEEKETRIGALREEVEALFKYYGEAMAEKVDLEAAMHGGVNAVVAAMMEERDLPLSKLVEEIFAAAKATCEGLTPASVKSAVLSVGQRTMYGVPNADADVLEDQSDSCLWCWETRDVKLLPKSVRGVLCIRRTCRKRIHERITAISEMIKALQMSESDQDYKLNLTKASSKLGKTHSEAAIRQLIAQLMQKNGTDLAQKEAKKEEKLVIKQLVRDKREAEKEKKRFEREVLKEKLQNEKEQKRLQEEAERDERRREKEESEMRRQLKKQQEEAEKDQRRREKEAAEQKKQLSIQKQASIMERFIKRSKTTPLQTDQYSTKVQTTDDSNKRIEKVSEAVTQSMDFALFSNENSNFDEICRAHLFSWRRLGNSIRSNRKKHWGSRQKPKTELFKQLKLTTSRPQVMVMDELEEEKLVDEFGECLSDDRSCHTNATCSLPDVKKFIRGKQLLQFDKSHRPAFYGIWPQKSQVVGPRHPFRMDPDLDYDVDSDEEWEEEDPGESLSDCDKDDEDESLQEGGSKADDGDDSEDGFFVPDGYLSENEGVLVDNMDTDVTAEAKSTPGLESGEFCALLQQQKKLDKLTEHALRKSQPLIISNLMHEKAPLLQAKDPVGTSKLEQTCLLALSMCLFPGSSHIEISLDRREDLDQEVCSPGVKDSATPSSTAVSLPDTDLRTLVSGIQSSTQGIHKLAERLHQKFPGLSKSQLRNKVREISEFVDNRWQVKKEVLQKLGLSVSPEKSSGRTKSIAGFFSKRCLPPSGESINLKAN